MSELFSDRLPPHHIEAEQSVLGAIFLDRDTFAIAQNILQPTDFYKPAHQKIFATMITLFEKRSAIDLVTVSSILFDKKEIEEIGGIGYLTDLAQFAPTSVNIEYYAKIVADKAIVRRLIKASTQIVSDCYDYDDEVAELISEAEKKILSISRTIVSDGFVPISKILLETISHIEKISNRTGTLTGISTGFIELDQITAGFQKSDLIIIAARPSVGKTAFALNVAQNAAKYNGVIAIFSLEMSSSLLVQRMLCAEANIDAGRLKTGNLDRDEWSRLSLALGVLEKTSIYIDDSPNIFLTDMRAKLRRLKADQGLNLVLIDYLQLIQVRGRGSENRQQEISEISRTLKAIARELEVPVVALSQLSRQVEQRQDKRPMLSDLRESGSIEQDADIVAFLYRDDYYNSESEKKNIIEVIISKHRNGQTGKVELLFKKEYNKFLNLAKTEES